MVGQKQIKVEQAFAAVLAARETSPRKIFETTELLGICEGDQLVQHEVLSLLNHLEAAGATSSDRTAFLDPIELHGKSGAGGALGDDALLRDWGGEAVGQRIDGFTIIGRLGEGGMGVVYVAQQDNPRRTVALKLMRRGIATTATQRRFEREAQILGKLNHPGIAQIYAAGIAQISAGDEFTRTPYIAMELVDGPDIAQYAIDHRRDVAMVVSLIVQACDAVQHAHHRGIIHRDLKPANILVCEDTVKVLDFGVARALGEHPENAELTEITHAGHLIGTLAYMAPEQLTSRDAVDTRADVYALGVVMFHLLSGRFPIDLADCGIADAALRIAEQDPQALTTPGREFPADLETIVAMALKKDPSRRYQSPGELARDLRLYQAGEPIEARRDSLLYVMGKRAKRYRSLLSAAVVALAGVALIALYARYQQRKAITARVEADRAAVQLADELSASRIEQARLLGASGNMHDAETMLWREQFAHPESTHAHWALWELYSRFPCIRTIAAHQGNSRCISFNADGSILASGGDDAQVKLWDTRDGRLVRAIHVPLTLIWTAELSPDGRHIASAGEGGPLVVYDCQSGDEVARPAGHKGTVFRVRWTSDGSMFASTGEDGTVRIWDAATFAPLAVLEMLDAQGKPADTRAVCFDAAGKRLAAASQAGAIRAWNLSRFGQNLVAEPDPTMKASVDYVVNWVSFSPDGKILAAASFDRSTRLWDTATGSLLATLTASNGNNRSVNFSPDGSQLAIAGYWRVDVWDVTSRTRIRPGGVESIVPEGSFCARYSPDGNLLAATGGDGTVKLWERHADGGAQTIAKHPTAVREVAAIRVGDEVLVASVGVGGTVAVRSASVANTASPLSWRDKLNARLSRSGGRCCAFSPDGTKLYVGRDDGFIEVFADGSEPHREFRAHVGTVNGLIWDPVRSQLISCGSDGVVRLWPMSAASTAPTTRPSLLASGLGEVLGMDISPDRRVLAVNDRLQRLTYWSLSNRRQLPHAPPMPFSIWSPTFSPDGRWLSGGSWDRSVVLWDASSMLSSLDPRELRMSTSLLGHSQLVSKAVFDDAGKLMASSSNDGTVKVWDVSAVPNHPGQIAPEPQRLLATLTASSNEALTISFLPAPRNGYLVVGYADGSTRVWDLHYFDRHIASQREYQLQRAASQSR